MTKLEALEAKYGKSKTGSAGGMTAMQKLEQKYGKNAVPLQAVADPKIAQKGGLPAPMQKFADVSGNVLGFLSKYSGMDSAVDLIGTAGEGFQYLANKGIEKVGTEGMKKEAKRANEYLLLHPQSQSMKKANEQGTMAGIKDVAGKSIEVGLSVAPYAKGLTAASVLSKAAKVKPAASLVGTTLGQKLTSIGTKTAINTVKGAGYGYGFDVSGNLKTDKQGSEILSPGWGTVIGGLIPAIIGTGSAAKAIGLDYTTKKVAPNLINSLVSPKKADFSYGKDPGKVVAELGIKGNDFDNLADNISTVKDSVGIKIGKVYSNPANANIKLDITPELYKIDQAIDKAAKGGLGNQKIVDALNNTKEALMYDHAINPTNGKIEKFITDTTTGKMKFITDKNIGQSMVDLENLSPVEAFALKGEVAGQTKFTGNPSDDKTVNAVLKSVYGSIKDKLNKAVGKNNPEIEKLNEQYGSLISAELAARNRDMILKKGSPILNLKNLGGGAVAYMMALVTGMATLPATLTTISGVVLNNLQATPWFRTRVAAWLAKETPTGITAIIQQNPTIKNFLIMEAAKHGPVLKDKINKIIFSQNE